MPVIEDNDELENLLQDLPVGKRDTTPRLAIGHAVARLNFYAPEGSLFEFSVGDSIALYEDVDELFWFGRNVRTGSEGKFQYLYVQQDIPNQSSDGSSNATLSLESISAINAREVARIKKRHQNLFGDSLDPITAFKVVRGLPSSSYWEVFHCFSSAFPTTAQWLSLLIFEIEGFRNFTSRHWSTLWCPGYFEFSLEGWPIGFETVIRDGPGSFQWAPTLRKCRASVPNIEEIWTQLHAEFLQIHDLDTYLNLDFAVKEMESLLKMFRSSLDAMEKAEDEANREMKEAEDLRSSSKTNLLLPSTASQNGRIDLEASTTKAPVKAWLQRLPLVFQKLWSQLLTVLGTPHGVLSTVIGLATIGAVTTAIATWKCSPPNSIPTIDSNFWSTVASSSIGTAGLFCTIIPVLRKQEIKVSNEKTFYRLLWASLVCGVAAAIVYMYQTKASLVLLFLSSAAQLATTLQIIYGAVDRISSDMVEIVRLKRAVGED